MEILAWKGMAISEAVIDTVHNGACQYRAGPSERRLLGIKLFFRLLASPRATGGTKSEKTQFADITIDSTRSGRHELTSDDKP